MATIEQVTMTDDLDNSVTEGVQTVNFFDPETGDKVELELGEKNAKALNKAIAGLEKYLAVARVVQAPKPVKATSGPKSDLAKVREWAVQNGYTVGDRGRIKAEILEAYDKAQMPTAVENDKVVLTVTPEAQVKLDEIAADIEASKDSDSVVDTAEVAQVESEQDSEPVTSESRRELTDDEILNLMGDLDAKGAEVTLDNLTEAAKQV